MPDGTPLSTIDGTILSQRILEYETIRKFIEKPPSGYPTIINPGEAGEETGAERVILVVATGVTAGDRYTWDSAGLRDPSGARGLVLRLKPEIVGRLSVSVGLFSVVNLEAPSHVHEPMGGLRLLGNGRFMGTGNESTADELLHFTSQAIWQGRLISPTLHTFNQIQSLQSLHSARAAILAL